MKIEDLGWSAFFAAQHTDPSAGVPARIVEEHRRGYRIHDGERERMADLPGRLRHEASSKSELPAVGDWVLIRGRAGESRAVINRVLPRKSKFSRKGAGQNGIEQVVAANVDTVFLVFSLNRDLNLRRLERYLAVAWESGAKPVVLLSKADLAEDADAIVASVRATAGEAPVHVVSALDGRGLDELEPYLAPGQTIALLGSSGVGKSTLVNRLHGHDVRKVQEIRDVDDKGRHTTTSRELVILPRGALMIDTPGMRELGLWDADRGIAEAFEDVEAFAADCRFRDCTHRKEPGCGVQGALADGKITRDRYEAFLKLAGELAAKKQRDREKSYRRKR